MTRTSTKTCTITVAEIVRTSNDALSVCTTTVVEDPYLYRFPNMNDYFHYERSVNVYFLYFASNENRPVCTLRRYNPDATFVNECL